MNKFTHALSLLLAGLLCWTCLLSCHKDDGLVTTAAADTTSAAETTHDPTDDPNGEITDPLAQENVFQKVTERMSRLKSFSMDTAMQMDISGEGMYAAVTAELNAVVDAAGKRYFSESTILIPPDSTAVINYYDDAIFYLETAGEKAYADMNAEMPELLSDMMIGTDGLHSADFESFKLYSTDDGYFLTVSGLKDGNGLLDSAIYDKIQEDLDICLGGVEIEISISKDFCITEIQLFLSMNMNIDEILEMMGEDKAGTVAAYLEIAVSYSDFDNADRIDIPDLSDVPKVALKDLIGGFAGDN
ncbi:MAG: DUF6612 family protein [Eubacteriales bacterium]